MYTTAKHVSDESASLVPTSYSVTKSFIRDRSARIGIVGLGYTGLRLAILFSNCGFAVDGFEFDPVKAKKLQARHSYLSRISSDEISHALDRGFRVMTDLVHLSETDVIIICTPERFDNHQAPTLRDMREASFSIASNLHAGHLVVVENSSYPGCTEEVIAPILEGANSQHLKISRNTAAPDEIFVGISPDRADSEDTAIDQRDVPKVVAGIDRFGAELTAILYGSVFKEVISVSSVSVAELSKLLENAYRSVNTALANELKQICLRMGVDPWEVINAASTKPFDFQPFYPTPGYTDPAILSDSLSLAWKAKAYGVRAKLVELATEINTGMPEFIVRCTGEALNRLRRPLKGSRVLLLGADREQDVDSVRDSPSLAIIELLRRAGAQVTYSSPLQLKVNRGSHEDRSMVSLSTDDISGYDAVVIATDHSSYDYSQIVLQAKLVIDTRNATRGLTSEKIVRC
jgi:UDP-N-acetyl-D-glucosamine dehydrogenase